MKRTIPSLVPLFLYFVLAASCFGQQNILAIKITEPPVIDGNGNDPVWNRTDQMITLDKNKGLAVAVKALYTSQNIYMLIRFKDHDESRTHKSWVWDNARSLYRVGYDREDIFVIKWNMEPEPVDLSIYSDDPYLADVWYWKAGRTDPAGYADDKMHQLDSEKDREALELKSKSGKSIYLTRTGDTGTSAYKIDLPVEYQDDKLQRHTNRRPSGSRADVRAKGNWQAGEWTIEFSRALETGNQDDVQFKPGKKYLLGVSRYEIAGRAPNKKLSQPLYGTGDINEMLWLHFSK